MQNFDEMSPLRNKLETYESQAPDFDSLFEGEILGEAPLRQICQAKLDTYKAESPSFDQLFKSKVSKNSVPKRRMAPLWISIGTAAACFTLLMLLPDKIQMYQEAPKLTESKHESKAIVRKKALAVNHSEENIQAEDIQSFSLLKSPKSIKALAIDKKDQQIREFSLTYENAQTERDSSDNHGLKKIKPSKKGNIAVNYERSVEEAYAAAKLSHSKAKREKMTLGTLFNGTNRLLSLVNTKSANSFPLQSVADKYSAGYSSLEGSSSSLLRTAVSSRNEWEAPDNIPNEILKKYDAVYSLPINVGISLSFPISRNLEIMTGLNYTYISGEISGNTSTYDFNLKQELHYIGIPVKIAMNIFKGRRFGAYAALGGAIEKGIAGIQNSHVSYTNGEKNKWDSNQRVYGIQPSLTGQLGLYYDLNKTFNIYVEPGASYFIPNDQPINIRTEEPFNFNLSLGLRYRIH
ncbi:MAG: outer membrane beta-barrel protein [Bacteroidales bacterium]|nr:outer membrane beta-barrel protein [Bacteroidales bacterium]MDD4713433.1 outer membrane beta-barrel protein [Bacteroidales bacterium]